MTHEEHLNEALERLADVQAHVMDAIDAFEPTVEALQKAEVILEEAIMHCAGAVRSVRRAMGAEVLPAGGNTPEPERSAAEIEQDVQRVHGTEENAS